MARGPLEQNGYSETRKTREELLLETRQDWLHKIDMKSAFLYGTIEEEVYVCQPPGFEDLHFSNKVYKVEKALYGLHQAPRAWYETLSTYLLENRFRRGTIDKTLFIKKDKSDILLVQVQDKYVVYYLKSFDYVTKELKDTITPMEPNKALVKNEEVDNVDVHLYKSMIGSLMYLTASRPDITFVVCACARFQVTPKTSHLHAVKRIFRYLKGQPKLGLWYPRDSPFDLEAFSDSDYAGASLDRKSTTGGCQFLGKRLISWQCKKQTIVANSTTEAEYVAAANCCGQVLWIQNQMLDYGFNFMNTKIYIDNESTICIVKNPKFHAKTKHIEIRHHFIRDSYEKRLIQVIKVHSDQNVADLLTKAFDVSRMVGRTCNIKRGRDTKIPQSGGPPVKVGDEVVHKELGDRMERAATTASSLEAEQDSVTTAGERVSTARAIPEEVSTAEPDMDVTLTEALVDLLKSGKKKSPKPKARGITFQDPEEVARREVISPPVLKISAKDKGKAIMTEPEKPLKKKGQIQSDEELALRLHAEEQAEFERLQKERAAQEEASRATI
ncbi:putative ribonuclease H-like domain-containing protein [Tanacetum coccineum]